jgi:hypothetical protein
MIFQLDFRTRSMLLKYIRADISQLIPAGKQATGRIFWYTQDKNKKICRIDTREFLC